MRRIAAAIAVLALLAAPVFAQTRAEDHLEPEDSILGGDAYTAGYESLVRHKLEQAYGFDVVARMVALPSFAPEYAVALASKTPNGKAAPYRIFVLTPAASLWTYVSIAMLKNGGVKVLGDDSQRAQKEEIARLESSVPRDPEDMKVKSCEADIGDALGNHIIELWRKMLLRTHYSVRNMNGLDGATYHFGITAPGTGLLAGKVWSPEPGTATGGLVQLADTMRAICQKEKGASESDLEKLAAELEGRLN